MEPGPGAGGTEVREGGESSEVRRGQDGRGVLRWGRAGSGSDSGSDSGTTPSRPIALSPARAGPAPAPCSRRGRGPRSAGGGSGAGAGTRLPLTPAGRPCRRVAMAAPSCTATWSRGAAPGSPGAGKSLGGGGGERRRRCGAAGLSCGSDGAGELQGVPSTGVLGRERRVWGGGRGKPAFIPRAAVRERDGWIYGCTRAARECEAQTGA